MQIFSFHLNDGRVLVLRKTEHGWTDLEGDPGASVPKIYWGPPAAEKAVEEYAKRKHPERKR